MHRSSHDAGSPVQGDMPVMSTAKLPKVVVIGLGGTISMARQSGGLVPSSAAGALVASLAAGVALPAQLEVVDLACKPSAHLSFEDLLDLAGLANERIRGGATGVVVLQGTDTIEETAFALDLLVAGTAPIVVTGALRAPGQPGSDAAGNLAAAVAVAASERARGLGTLVVFGDEIHHSRLVAKEHAFRPAAFSSPAGGPLGFVAEGRVLLNWVPAWKPVTLPLEAARNAGQVVCVTCTLGSSPLSLQAATGCDGIVVAGFGAGHVPLTWIEPLVRLAQRMPVVIGSRIGSGPILRETYGYPGSEVDLLSRGLVSAGSLSAPKAATLLSLALGAGYVSMTLGELFANVGQA